MTYAFALSGPDCPIIPDAGPAASDVIAGGKGDAPNASPYEMVPASQAAVAIIARSARRLSFAFADRVGTKGFRFRIGDVVTITVFESAAGGFFCLGVDINRTFRSKGPRRLGQVSERNELPGLKFRGGDNEIWVMLKLNYW